jgi:hypothetical protein
VLYGKYPVDGLLDKGIAHMTYKLGDITEIQLGHAFRSGIEADLSGDVRLVQLRDLSSPSLDLKSLTRIPQQDWNDSYNLKPGDLVFRSRAGNYGFAQIPDTSLRLILAAPLFRVRVDVEVLRSEFLLWYAGLEGSQEYFAKMAEGTAQKMINRKGLEDFPIDLPLVEIQDKIIHIKKLQTRENEVLHHIHQKRTQLINHILTPSLKTRGASHVQ